MGSFAADQVISPDELFQEAVREAIHAAAAGKIVTIGIKPTHPSTGFGYIRAGKNLGVDGAPSAQAVVEFVEKPSEEDRPAVRRQRRLRLERRDVRGARLADAQAPRSQPARAVRRGCRRSPGPGTPRSATRSRPASGPPCPRSPLTTPWPNPPRPPATSPSCPGTFRWDDVGDFASVGRLNSAKEVDDVTVHR